MMNGNYGGGWMNGGWTGGGWFMIIGGIVCIAIIVAVVWLVMRWMKNNQTAPHSSQLQRPYASQMDGKEAWSSREQSTEPYEEGEKLSSYTRSGRQQEPPLN